MSLTMTEGEKQFINHKLPKFKTSILHSTVGIQLTEF